MTFSLFSWCSIFTAIVLQLTVYRKLREPQSLRYLMLWLTLGNLVAIAAHPYPKTYWVTLWIGRMVSTAWFCWAAGDLVSRHEPRVPFTLRLPVVACVAMAFQCLPWRPGTFPSDLEAFRWHGLFLAVAIVVAGIIWLVPAGVDLRLPIALAACLTVEGSVALLAARTGPATRTQMTAWAVAMAVLASATTCLASPRTSRSSSEDQPSFHLAASGAGGSDTGPQQPPG